MSSKRYFHYILLCFVRWHYFTIKEAKGNGFSFKICICFFVCMCVFCVCMLTLFFVCVCVCVLLARVFGGARGTLRKCRVVDGWLDHIFCC